MKIFQIEKNICFWDATPKFPTLQSLKGYFPPELLFVEAPDYVFEGWGYNNGIFIKPEAPEGWKYNDKTGTFYPDIQEEEVLKSRYHELCKIKINAMYSASDETQILREYLANPENETKKQIFIEYNNYVNNCLIEAKNEIYGTEQEEIM